MSLSPLPHGFVAVPTPKDTKGPLNNLRGLRAGSLRNCLWFPGLLHSLCLFHWRSWHHSLPNFCVPTQMDNLGSNNSSVRGWFYPLQFDRLQNASRRSLLWLSTTWIQPELQGNGRAAFNNSPTIFYLMTCQLQQCNRNKLVTPNYETRFLF